MEMAFAYVYLVFKRLFPDVKLGLVVDKTKRMPGGKVVDIVN